MSEITYKPNIMMFYGENANNEYKITPAPNINISVNTRYANDTIIGYNYTITLTGTITSLNLQDLNWGENYDTLDNQGSITKLVDGIARLRKILNQNGNILYIVNARDSNDIFFKAKNGKLISFDVSQSNDNWKSTAPFTATIEFDAIEINEAEDCSNPLFDSSSYPTDLNGVVNLSEYKLKSFNDSWSFDFPESMYDKMAYTDCGNFININSIIFTIQYQIQAVGSDYMVYTNDDLNSDGEVTPAWLQAKKFVQKRLHTQVTSLIDGVLKTYGSGCSSTDTLQDINIPGSTASGLLSSLGDDSYVICNETINCQSSESEGSFSASYNATVCSKLGNGLFSSPYATHKVNKTKSENYDYVRPETRVTLNGTIQGMIEGGLIRNGEALTLPDSGALLVKGSQSQTKHANARGILNNIFSHSDYNSGIGKNGKKDLKQFYKDLFCINAETLGITPAPDDNLSDSLPHPVNFTLTEDRSNGIITYTVEYSDIVNRCGKTYTAISVETEDKTKVYAMLDIPGGGCAVIQKLGTYTPVRTTISIEGKDDSIFGKPPAPIDLESLIRCEGGNCQAVAYLPISLPQGAILTQQQYTNDPVTGSFQITISYICNNGCQ